MTVAEVFVRRTSLEQVVKDLTRRNDYGRPLLEQLDELVAPSQQMVSPDGPGGGRSKAHGSPAPWSSAPAELLDAILRGALRFDRQGRQVLAWPDRMVPRRFAQPISKQHRGPVCSHCEHASCDRIRWQPTVQVPIEDLPLGEAGRVALAGLPGIVLELSRVEHPLGVRIDPHTKRVHQGLIEQALRSWHKRALDLIGVTQPWERLPSIPNPDHPKFSHGQDRRRRGPVCVSCAHQSCNRIRKSSKPWLPWLCPLCGSDSLRMDPVDGTVHCLRPACAESGEATWTREELYASSTDPWDDDLEQDEDEEADE